LEQEIAGRESDEAASYLESIANRIRSMGHEVQTTIIVDRQPARAILDYARHEGLELIALSTRGRGGLSRMVLGSVADEVLRNTGVPVLVYRIGDDDDQP
jgi:nucleotide-binding universal stress UspA family protein